MATDPPPPAWKQALRQVALTQGTKAAASAAAAAGWPVILAVVVVLSVAAVLLGVALFVAISNMENQRSEFIYQCQSRLGYSVGNTASVTVIPSLAENSVDPAAPSTRWEIAAIQPATTAALTTNPASTIATTTTTPTTTTTAPTTINKYADMTVPPDAEDRTAACASAVKTGELAGPPLHTESTAEHRRAATIAAQQVGLAVTVDAGSPTGPTENAISPANLVRYAYFDASQGTLLMPQTIAEQISVGDRVDPDAISAGDLVFSEFTAQDGPTVVMIAVSPTRGVAATIGEPITVTDLPVGNIIVKRPHLKVKSR